MIESAIRARLTTLGFADHSPQYSEDETILGYRMPVSEAHNYVSVLRNLAEEYKEDIRILVGFEAEYLPKVFGDLYNLCGTENIDYLIMGQHCLAYPDGLGHESVCARNVNGRPSSPLHTLKSYVDTLIEGMNTGCFTYICHPDMYYAVDIGDAEFRGEYSRLCLRAKELDIPLEINNLGYTDRRHYPTDRLFSLAKEFGNKLIVGLDAHTPEQINPDNIAATVEYAEKFGLEIVDMPSLRAPWKND